MVRAFHRALGPDAHGTPTGIPPDLAAHRGGRSLAEEAREVAEAPVTGPLGRFAHEPADVVRVADGVARVHGIGPDTAIAQVHRSDLTERGPDGTVLEGGRHEVPDVRAVLRRQGRAGRPQGMRTVKREKSRPGRRGRCSSHR
ncbi:hypothetical protein C1708_08775 [Streptomyces sp. DH-12]|uniref:hypothetical protein n=1 Tax=unclassified Streptomyces TaxID=2593676 RepID=UPI000CCEE333|nr:hypothetical protein [Streptomyces sp. DH-12]PNV32382.1 hypothetical protein C1708_08775 [Streptomyces sp. DH-12]